MANIRIESGGGRVMLRIRHIGSPSPQECRPKPLRMAGRFVFYTPESCSEGSFGPRSTSLTKLDTALDTGDAEVHPR